MYQMPTYPGRTQEFRGLPFIQDGGMLQMLIEGIVEPEDLQEDDGVFGYRYQKRGSFYGTEVKSYETYFQHLPYRGKVRTSGAAHFLTPDSSQTYTIIVCTNLWS